MLVRPRCCILVAGKRHEPVPADYPPRFGVGPQAGGFGLSGGGVFCGGCHLHNNVTIDGPSEIGENNEFYSYASIGQRTQDLKYDGEPTYLKVGNNNTFREFVTVNRATSAGDATIIGSHVS